MQESENVAAGLVQRIMKLHTRISADDSKARLVSAIDVEKWSLSPSHSYPVVAAKLVAGFMMSPRDFLGFREVRGYSNTADGGQKTAFRDRNDLE